jgi:hypothetical protein
LSQLVLAFADGVGTEARDAGQKGDAAAATLSGEEADEEAAATLVAGRHQAVDVLVFLGRGAVRLLLTDGAVAPIGDQSLNIRGHTPLPPTISDQRVRVL